MRVEDIAQPLIGLPYASIEDVNLEFSDITSKIISAASKCLPHTGSRKSKKKSYIRDESLQMVCKEQRQARKRWTDAGRPRSGSLFEKQKTLKR